MSSVQRSPSASIHQIHQLASDALCLVLRRRDDRSQRTMLVTLFPAQPGTEWRRVFLRNEAGAQPPAELPVLET